MFTAASRRRLPNPRLVQGVRQRPYSSPPSNHVRIVEVGPRDGLQNEKTIIPPEVKVELINRLGQAGMKLIEAGSFVSPKWVPQVSPHAQPITGLPRGCSITGTR